MKKTEKIIQAAALVLAGVLIGYFIGIRFMAGSVPGDVSLVSLVPPQKADASVFEAAEKVVKNYCSGLHGVEKIRIRADAGSGVVETDWYPVRKGEVGEKVQALVWGDHFRVEVWHRAGRGRMKAPFKSEISRVVERRLQENLEEALKSGPVR